MESLLKAIIILPGTVLVFVPSVIFFVSRETRFSLDLQYPSEVTFWLAIAVASSGGYLAVKTATLFMKLGDGTPAPWEPPKKLVVAGPYRYVRNLMITGVLLILLGETVLFNSWPLFLWMIIFLVGNMIYFPLVEEKGLKQRFGEPYLEYMAHVPRWIPRFKAWR
ncbi:MAG: isoprenylcysteine carboxylmethyltransferase family protein, partial [Deltaproteobacteria bacterium]|nr:isoprenylcysteine carboxylmethyltransferase family protein [Deltaproteobacteria bacterium]